MMEPPTYTKHFIMEKALLSNIAKNVSAIHMPYQNSETIAILVAIMKNVKKYRQYQVLQYFITVLTALFILQ